MHEQLLALILHRSFSKHSLNLLYCTSTDAAFCLQPPVCVVSWALNAGASDVRCGDADHTLDRLGERREGLRLKD